MITNSLHSKIKLDKNLTIKFSRFYSYFLLGVTINKKTPANKKRKSWNSLCQKIRSWHVQATLPTQLWFPFNFPKQRSFFSIKSEKSKNCIPLQQYTFILYMSCLVFTQGLRLVNLVLLANLKAVPRFVKICNIVIWFIPFNWSQPV